MKNMKKGLLFVLLLVGFTTISNAQKFGYVNSQELLVSLPEIKAADAELETFQNQLITKGQNKVQAWQQKVEKYRKDVEAGILSQVQVQQTEGQLAQEQTDIQKFEVEVQEKIAAKRETLYKPILDKVKAAIEAYGKENGYTMIFDTSSGSLLHASDSDNLLDEIKARL